MYRQPPIINVTLLLLAILVIIIAGLAIIGGSAGQPAGPPPTPTPHLPSNAVVMTLYTSGTKRDWVVDVAKTFNSEGHQTATGKPIWVEVKESDSGAFLDDLQAGEISEPTVWSPGEISWVNEANVEWNLLSNKPLVSEDCSPTVYTIIGIGMWKPMAEAMGWPDKPISWDQIVGLAADPQGWARYGHPEWGQFKFGHTHPGYSNTGLLAMTSLVYNTLDITDGLTPEMVKSKEVVQAMQDIEDHTYHYGLSTRALFTLMAQKGPSYLSAATNSEPGVWATNKNNPSMQFPLVFIIPSDGAYWSDNPYCLIDADWVTDGQREAAGIFKDYLLAAKQQDHTLDFGMRPIDPNIPLRDPITADWTDPDASPETIPALGSFSGETNRALQDVFLQTKKKATVIVLLDASGSMRGEKIENAREATANFISRLHPEDEVFVYRFSDGSYLVGSGGLARDVGETLEQQVRGIQANGGTALYNAICGAISKSNYLKTTHEAENQSRLYGVIVLSDGQDTANQMSQTDMFNCLPTGEDVEGVKIFTIAYGSDADKDLLKEIATRTGGRAFSGDPATIDDVYLAISAEQ